MVGNGQCHLSSSTLQPKSLCQGWVKGQIIPMNVCLTKFKHLRKGSTPLIGTSPRCLAREPAFPVFREGERVCGCAHSASVMPGPWIKSRVLDKPLSPSCWAPACLSKVLSFRAVHFSNIEPLLAQGILRSLSPSCSLSSLNMLFLCLKYLSSPSHCQPDSVLTVHGYLG